MSRKRGAGYWLWKPFFIYKTLKDRIKYGDFLVYSDSGSLFVNSVRNLINIMIRNNSDIMTFKLNYSEKIWTKRDIFITLDCDKPEYYDSNQMNAAFIILKKTNFSISFIEQWLNYSRFKNLILDTPNELGKPNYPEFKGNRHDQSILSLMVKKYNLTMFNDPTEKKFDTLRRNYNKQLFFEELKFPFTFWNVRNKIGLTLNQVKKTKNFIKYKNILSRYYYNILLDL